MFLNELEQNNEKVLKGILEKAISADASADPIVQLVGNYWATGMDSAAIEKAGGEAIQPYLDKINGIDNKEELVKSIAWLQSIGARPAFGL